MIDARTRASVDERKTREQHAMQIAERLVHDNVLWIGSRVYDIRYKPKGRRAKPSKTPQTLAGIEAIHNLYISGHGTFFVPGNDLFGRFYDHVDVSELTDDAINEFLYRYGTDRSR